MLTSFCHKIVSRIVLNVLIVGLNFPRVHIAMQGLCFVELEQSLCDTHPCIRCSSSSLDSLGLWRCQHLVLVTGWVGNIR